MKTRFCPSPTGHLHIGNMRTALFNYLYANKVAGTFLLRIEDTDLERSKNEFSVFLQNDLSWLGLDWSEGVAKGGEFGPYLQSKRVSIYKSFYDKLIENKRAYHCFCTEEELTRSRKLQAASGKPPKYSGKCRNLSESEIENQFNQGKKAALRFHVPHDQKINFDDLVRGTQRFWSNDLGDFIIRKTDGMASFMFANAIDDALMEVTHVFRGEDHLTNTPRQILILKELGLPIAIYAHISIILGQDKQPLSKRNGSKSIQSLKEQGYLPLAIVNYLARIGHTYSDNGLLSLKELSSEFSVGKLVKSPAIFDKEQLNMWQKLAVLACSDDEFLAAFGQEIEFDIDDNQKKLFMQTMKQNISMPSELKSWATICFNVDIEYSATSKDLLKNVDHKFFDVWLNMLNNNSIDVKELYAQINQALGIKGRAIYQPIRIALTNTHGGAELQNIANIMGVEMIKSRIARLKEIL